MRNPLLDLADPELGTVFLASNTLQEFDVRLDDASYGAFTQAMLNTIRDKTFDTSPRDGDSLFNPVEIASGVTRQVNLLTKDQQHPVFFTPELVKRKNVLELLQN